MARPRGLNIAVSLAPPVPPEHAPQISNFDQHLSDQSTPRMYSTGTLYDIVCEPTEVEFYERFAGKESKRFGSGSMSFKPSDWCGHYDE